MHENLQLGGGGGGGVWIFSGTIQFDLFFTVQSTVRHLNNYL